LLLARPESRGRNEEAHQTPPEALYQAGDFQVTKEEFFFEGKYSEKMTIRRTEDVEPVIEQATVDRNDLDNGFSKSRNWRKIGSLPLIVIDEYYRTTGIDLMKPENVSHVKKLLNEFSKFKTVDKKL
jgi:hypothetical protein